MTKMKKKKQEFSIIYFKKNPNMEREEEHNQEQKENLI
jgi:hypothetical protein